LKIGAYKYFRTLKYYHRRNRIYKNNNIIFVTIIFVFAFLLCTYKLSVTYQKLSNKLFLSYAAYSNVEYIDMIFVYSFCNGTEARICEKTMFRLFLRFSKKLCLMLYSGNNCSTSKCVYYKVNEKYRMQKKTKQKRVMRKQRESDLYGKNRPAARSIRSIATYI